MKEYFMESMEMKQYYIVAEEHQFRQFYMSDRFSVETTGIIVSNLTGAIHY